MNNSTNSNRWLFVVTLLLLTANIVTLALLWTNKGGGKREHQLPAGPGGQVFEFLTHELKLDSVQQEAYKKLRDEHQAGARPLQDSIRSTKDAFFALLQQANVPESTLTAYSNKASNAAAQMDLFTFKHFQ
jgi:Spy/CpxP family protein refolding chaperone